MPLPDSPPSLWLAEYGPYVPSPALAGDLGVDVAVVGGGFQGLATAIALRKAAPSVRVAVLEHEVVGYGASGRNGSFAMTVVGLGIGTMARLKGRQFVREAHRYMERAVDGLENLIREHGLECDMTRPGFLRMATTSSYARRHPARYRAGQQPRARGHGVARSRRRTRARSIRRSTWVRCGSRDSCS